MWTIIYKDEENKVNKVKFVKFEDALNFISKEIDIEVFLHGKFIKMYNEGVN